MPVPRGVMVAVSVTVAMVLVLVATAGAWLLVDDGDSVEVTAPAGGPDDAPPDDGATSTTGDPDASVGELEAEVAELSEFVEEERGLEFLEPVEVELADDAEFEQRLLDDFEDDDEADLRDTEAIFRALGLIDDDADLVEQYRGLLAAGVVGLYDAEANELVVRGTALTPYTRQTIAHELTHALDDQHFELFRPELDDADDESGFGLAAVTEGDASVVENAFEDELSTEELDELFAEESSLGSGTDFSQFADILLTLIAAPYDLGEPLVESILEAEGQDRLDAAFEEPPTTSEQVLHPERFLAGEEAIAVPEPAADGEVFDDGNFGELFVDLLLSDGPVVTPEAQAAGEGWGGDHYVAWREGADRACIRTAFVMDTPADLDELATGLTEWAADQDDAEVRVGERRVVMTSCG